METLHNAYLLLFIIYISLRSFTDNRRQGKLYGRLVDEFRTDEQTNHGVNGTVYVVNNSTIFIKGFSYHNKGVDAFFHIKNRGSDEILKINFPAGGSGQSLGEYSYKDIVLTMPDGQDVSSIETLYVKSRNSKEEKDIYGLVQFYSDLSIPKGREIGKFIGIDYDLSNNVIIKDAKTLFIPQFYFVYDAPQAYFFVGKGLDRTNPVIKVSDHRGSYAPIKPNIKAEDISITLPGDLNVYEIEWLSIWSEDLNQEFGHTEIPSPQELNVPPYMAKETVIKLPLETHDYDYTDFNIPNLTSRKSLAKEDNNTCGVEALRSNVQICILTISLIIVHTLH